jgi:hypothetical protein
MCCKNIKSLCKQYIKVTLQMHLETSLIVCQCVLLGGVQNKLESTCLWLVVLFENIEPNHNTFGSHLNCPKNQWYENVDFCGIQFENNPL